MDLSNLPKAGFDSGLSFGVGVLAVIVYVFLISMVVTFFLNMIFGISLLNKSIKGEDTTKQKKRLRNCLVYTLIVYLTILVLGYIARLFE